MLSMLAKDLLIKDGLGKTGLAIRPCKILKLNGFEVKIKNTSGHGDAKNLAFEAVQDGAESIIGCGGDGTIHEIINEKRKTSKVN